MHECVHRCKHANVSVCMYTRVCVNVSKRASEQASETQKLQVATYVLRPRSLKLAQKTEKEDSMFLA